MGSPKVSLPTLMTLLVVKQGHVSKNNKCKVGKNHCHTLHSEIDVKIIVEKLFISSCQAGLNGFIHRHFYLPAVNVKDRFGHGILSKLFPCLWFLLREWYVSMLVIKVRNLFPIAKQDWMNDITFIHSLHHFKFL